MTALETLKNCTVKNNIVYLPPTQLDRKVYTEVKKSLELIGGEWKSGKIQGFVFKSDPSDLLEQIASGEKRNLKKEFQFFATPSEIADYLVELAEIDENAGQMILEPSAGQGAIIHAINRKFPTLNVDYFELMDINRTFLEKIPTAQHIGNNFLSVEWIEGSALFDRIIANPPFSKNQDIDHVYKMYESLNTGGRLVSIMSTHWKQSSNKKETIFRGWLENIDASIYPIQKGAFKESGTMIESCIVVIDK
jgi:hypothetical protein